jgi:hypothetical protein
MDLKLFEDLGISEPQSLVVCFWIICFGWRRWLVMFPVMVVKDWWWCVTFGNDL